MAHILDTEEQQISKIHSIPLTSIVLVMFLNSSDTRIDVIMDVILFVIMDVIPYPSFALF